MMKHKIIALMLCIVVLGLTTSCSKDNEDLIIGTWKCVSSMEERTSVYHDPQTYIDREVGTIVEFTEDGKMNMFGGGNTDYYVSGNTLYSNGGRNQYEIKKLNKKELTLFTDEKDEWEGYTATLNFERQ